MTPAQFTVALLALSPVAIGATPFLGSPWPGVALAALALCSHAWQAYMAPRSTKADEQLAALAKRLEEVEGEVRSVRNFATVRRNIGG